MKQEQNEQTKRKSIFSHWVFLGMSISLLLSLGLILIHPYIVQTEDNSSPVLETEQNLSWICESTYLLYHDLYNKVNQSDISYMELYLEAEEGVEWILEDDAWERYHNGNYDYEGILEGGDFSELLDETDIYRSYFRYVENMFSQLNTYYDYVAEDLESGEKITNMADTEINPSQQKFYISLLFDEHGRVSIEDIQGENKESIRRIMTELTRSTRMISLYDMGYIQNLVNNEYVHESIYPAGCRIQYAVTETAWAQIVQDGYAVQTIDGYWTPDVTRYYAASFLASIVSIMILFCFFAALILPVKCEEDAKPWKKLPALCLPLEVLVIAGSIAFSFIPLLLELSHITAAGESFSDYLFMKDSRVQVVFYLLTFLVYGGYLFLWYCFGISAKAIPDMGIKRYIKERCLFYQFFPLCKRCFLFIKEKILKIYDDINHFDVTRNAHKTIIKIVLVNAVILFVIGSLWFSGVAIAIVYSILLYFLLRKYISDLQKKYSILLHATNEIAQGNLNVAIVEDLGVFEPFKPQIIRIQDGFKNAVEEEVKSQRMKAELITNVSHDLKTPLTAIITYINLLKDEKITEEQRRDYLDTLERKSLRLKVLIEDLFEVSKANTQNIQLNIMDVDLLNLVRQVAFETSDKLKESNLELRMKLPEEKWIFPLDSQKTYRIYENLFANISKYALPGTRVYVEAVQDGDLYKISLKNITAQEIQVSAEELTDRFVRGDSSRNTEGSGLGLAIAKSFLQIQGGNLELQVDGDLFKATTVWTLPQ